MHFYQFHLGDYAAHTAHLSPMEDLAYRRLLDLYYLREGPLAGTPEQLARIIRMRDHADSVRQVLLEFFEEESDVGDNPAPMWRSKRCDAELVKFRAMAEGGRKGAAKRWAKPADEAANGGAIATPSTPQCQPITNTQYPSSSLRSEEGERAKARATTDRPADVSEEAWASFLALRRAKKAPVTALALTGLRREADKAGLTLEQALGHCCARGWTGFKADWVKGDDSLTKRGEAAQSLMRGLTRNVIGGPSHVKLIG